MSLSFLVRYTGRVIHFLTVVVCVLCISINVVHAAVTTYDFNTDTLGGVPAGTTVNGGTFQVTNNGTLGYSLRATAPPAGSTVAGIMLNNFESTANYTLTWKEAYAGANNKRHGFIVRAQPTGSYTVQPAMRDGYLIQVNYQSSDNIQIYKITSAGFTQIGSNIVITRATPKYFRVVLSGTSITVQSSNDGVSFSTLRTVIDSTYTTGGVQYTAGYVGFYGDQYVDDVTQDVPDVTAPVLSAITATTPGPISTTIGWSTNEAATSQVNYGTTDSYGTNTTLDSDLVTTHTVPLTGLLPNTTYHYRVVSTDASGNTATSTDQTFTTSAPTAPSAPTDLTLSPSYEAMGLSWTAPSANGSAISDYIVEYKLSSDSTWNTYTDGTSTDTNATVLSLQLGSSYDFRVSAINSVGTGPVSTIATDIPSNTPLVPSVPRNVSAIAYDEEAVVTFDPPTSNGGSVITSYTVTASPGGATATGSASPLTITGLTNDTAYTFVVTATNAVGTSNASDASSAVTPVVQTVSITTPKEYQVFQRNDANQASISITGTYTGSPTSIEASWNGGVYTTITTNPSGGVFSGTLTDQTGGQGTLTVRFTNDTSISTTKAYVGVGDMYVIAGQSNASGRGFSPQVYSHPTLKAGLFGNDDTWKEMVDPTDTNIGQIDAVSSDFASGSVNSVWPLLATYILADQSVPVAFIPTAKGGSAISAWQRNLSASSLYGSMYRRINAVGGNVKAVLFFQGETDAQSLVSQSTYLAQLNNFANSVANDFDTPTMVGMIGNSSFSDAGNNTIRLAQKESWDTNSNILAGPTILDVNLVNESGDNLHVRSNLDLAVFAARWWAALKGQVYEGSDEGRGPQLQSITHNSSKSELLLNFADVSGFNTDSISTAVFTVKDDGVPVSLTSVTRVSSTQLKLTLAAPASGEVTVSLASGSTGYSGTMPKDASTYALPAETFIDEVATLLGAPSEPSDLSVVQDGTSVALSWTAPSANGATITDYTIEYKPSTSLVWATYIDAINASTSTSLVGIPSNVAYDFRVSATNSVGTGNPSNTVTVTITVENNENTRVYGYYAPSMLTLTPINTSAPVDCLPAYAFSPSTGKSCKQNTGLFSTQISKTAFMAGRDLKIGMIGEDVKVLQAYLNTHGFPVATSGPGSKGLETTKFGGLTQKALIKFQIANKITPAIGYFGPKTRAVINAIK